MLVGAALLLVGAVGLVSFKAAMEGAVTSRRLSEQVVTVNRVIASLTEHVSTVDRTVNAAGERERELAALLDSVDAKGNELAAQSEQLAKSVDELREAALPGLAEDVAGLGQAHERLGRTVEQVRAAAIRAAHQIDYERRVRLADQSGLGVGSADTAPSEESGVPDPVTLARLISDIDTGQIPAEHLSDAFSPDVVGLSGRKFRTLVAELVRAYAGHGVYLEIGTYRGRTICTSAVHNPHVPHVGVDNFSQVDDDGVNRSIFDALVDQLGLDNIEFIERDFNELLAERTRRNIRDVAVYYFDASHDHRSQLMALAHGAQQVIPGGVMIVDDCNYSHVRAASYDFCELEPDWALLFERYTAGHPNKVDGETYAALSEGWWDGVHVLVHDPAHVVERLERQADARLESFFLQQHRPEHCHTTDVVSRSAEVYRSS